MSALPSEPDRIQEYIDQQMNLDLLRFITCGSVDDGKSTLIGRMLYEAQLIFDDQVASLQNDSKKHGTQEGEIDFALLVDGLSAERRHLTYPFERGGREGQPRFWHTKDRQQKLERVMQKNGPKNTPYNSGQRGICFLRLPRPLARSRGGLNYNTDPW